jgi:O-antigen/teichoic acid export membrane protein
MSILDDPSLKDAPESGGERVRNVVQGMGSLTIQNIATALLGFLFLAALLRLLPNVQYGVYSAVTVAVNIAGTFAIFGLNQTIARYLAFLGGQDEARSWIAARKILQLGIVFTLAATVCYSALAPFLSLYFTKSASWTGIFLLSGGYLFLTSLANICQGIIQGLKKYVLLAKILLVSKVAMVAFAVATLFIYPDVLVAIVSWIIFSLVTIGWVFHETYGNLSKKSGNGISFSEIMKYTYPLGIAGIISVIATSADLVIVGGYLGAVPLGIYSAAVTISSVLSVVLIGPLTTAFLPEISTAASGGNVSNGLRLALRFVALIVLPASLFVTAVASQLISLFSGKASYLAGTPSLEIIALFYVFLGVQMILVVLFQAIGKTSYAMVVGLVTAASDVGVALILVPQFGIVGAAFGKVSVALIGAFVGIYLARKYLHNMDRLEFYLKCLTSAAIPSLVTFALSRYLSERTITLVPYAVIFLGIFLACVKTFKLLSNEDRVFLSHIFPKSLGKFLDYL